MQKDAPQEAEKWRELRGNRTLEGEELQGLKIGSSADESLWERALGLVYRKYLQQGLVAPAEDPIYCTPYHLTDSLALVHASLGDRVLGTAGLVVHNELGFPSERILGPGILASIRHRCGEITGLAIDSKTQVHGGLLLPFFRFIFQMATVSLGLDYLLITVHPRHIRYYEQVLLFERVSSETLSHPAYMDGAPSVPAIVDIRAALRRAPAALREYMTEPGPELPARVSFGCPEGGLRSRIERKVRG